MPRLQGCSILKRNVLQCQRKEESVKVYLDLIEQILLDGQERKDRTGVGTLSLFGHQARYDLRRGFPLVTTKKVHFKSVVCELLWFLRGDTNTAWLKQQGVSIWDEWADENGDLGPIYGHQWRRWGAEGIDQIAQVIDGLKKNPFDRRLIVSAWNPSDLPRMKLPPCHAFMQFYADQQGFLSCQLYQRSADVFLGVPFNIASYSLLTTMIAQVTGLKAGEFIHTLGDAHLYLNHLEQAKRQIQRRPHPRPELTLNREVSSIDDFGLEDIHLEEYRHHPHIKAPVAI